MKTIFTSLSIILLNILPGISYAEQNLTPVQDYMPSLITATPLEGRNLAIKIVRKTIGAIQRNAEIKQRIRKIYAEDPVMLMRSAELVNMEFKIIAEANNYWKK